jgi:hypothetical protein
MTGKPDGCGAGRRLKRNLRVTPAGETRHRRKRHWGPKSIVRSRMVEASLQNLAANVLFHQDRYFSVRWDLSGSDGGVFGQTCRVEVPSGAAFGEAAQMRWPGEPLEIQAADLRVGQAGQQRFWLVGRMRIGSTDIVSACRYDIQPNRQGSDGMRGRTSVGTRVWKRMGRQGGADRMHGHESARRNEVVQDSG